jgi:DNA-binding CsgD family transcriptional regulator
VARAGIASARDYGLARSTGTFLAINVAEPLVSLGRWDEAIEAIEHALALSPPRGNRLALRQLAGDIALRRGDLADARELADAASAALSRTGKQGCREAQCYLPVARLEAELFLAEGKPADARDVVTVAADCFDLVHNPRYAWPLLAVGARACAIPAVVRGPAAAERSGDLLGRLRTLAGKMDARGPVQLAGRLTFAAEAGPELADEADDGHALAQWDAAAAAWERATQPYQVAAAMLRAADAAMTAGDRDAAAERLRRAADLADQLGARPLAEEIGLFARNARLALGAGRDDSSAAPRPLGLTARESEVLRLVAAGRSNPEIAAELFISAKTASVHVSNILAKLSVGSRGEAAAAAYRLRLFDPAPVR